MPRSLRCSRFDWNGLLLALLFTVPGAMLAQTQQEPARLRVAIIGLEHGHVEGFLSALPQHHDVELVGIADPDPALAAKYEKKYSLDHGLFFLDMDKMIEARHPQAVLVYTSIGEHRKVIEAAARHGVSVMVEKPLTISLEDALAIRKVARQYHIHVLVNYETTWYASNRAAYDELEAGKLGEIRRVVIHDGHQGPKEIGVPPEFLNFLTDPAQNGAGALYDFGCYGADLMVWLMHGEAPLTVTAVLNHDKPQIYPNVDDDATIVLTYPHTQAVIQASELPGRSHARRIHALGRPAAGWPVSGKAGQVCFYGTHWNRRRAELSRNQCHRHADSGCGAGVGADRKDGAADEARGVALRGIGQSHPGRKDKYAGCPRSRV